VVGEAGDIVTSSSVRKSVRPFVFNNFVGPYILNEQTNRLIRMIFNSIVLLCMRRAPMVTLS